MSKLKLFYATNRGHITGRNHDRWNPVGYGKKFSSDGMENLRFGKVSLQADDSKIDAFLADDSGFGVGNGTELSDYLSDLASQNRKIDIRAYREKLDPKLSDANQAERALYGSRAMFAELQKAMAATPKAQPDANGRPIPRADVLVFIHGYNVAWNEAVGSALALQEMLNRRASFKSCKQIVVLFSWPSNGEALPHVSYKSDRGDARASGPAVGRGFLKLRDFLIRERSRQRDDGAQPCGGELNVLAHSMGNYVLQHAVDRVAEHTPGHTMPRLFGEVMHCAADVDDDVFEPNAPLAQLNQLARNVNVYFNRGDAALHISDFTKGNPERLGTNGVASLARTHNKIHQVDCSGVVEGFVEHSYYLDGAINDDIRMSLAGLTPEHTIRRREQKPGSPNEWVMVNR